MQRVSTFNPLAIAGTALLLAGLAVPFAAADDAIKALLEWDSGTWDATITIPDPLGGGEPQVANGEQIDRLGAGGGWLITDLHMEASGAPDAPPAYHGHGVLGFDPAREKLVGWWIDPLTTWLSPAVGALDDTGRKLTLEVEGRHPATGEPMPQHWVTTRLGDDSKRLEISVELPDGGRMSVLTIDYLRRKDTQATPH